MRGGVEAWRCHGSAGSDSDSGVNSVQAVRGQVFLERKQLVDVVLTVVCNKLCLRAL